MFETPRRSARRGYAGGRSINLALAERGLHALRLAGADEAVMAQAVMMRGRMVHVADGHTELLRYGRDDSEVIWSVHRGRLNISAARRRRSGRCAAAFRRAAGRRRLRRRARCASSTIATAARTSTPSTSLIGADGAGSALRAAMDAARRLGERFEPLGHGYKELEIPPAPDGGFRIEPNALHIWPRGGYMCIALPNDRAHLHRHAVPAERRRPELRDGAGHRRRRARCSSAISPMRCR